MLERQLSDQKASYKEQLAVPDEMAVPSLQNELKEQLDEAERKVLPHSAIDIAIKYSLKQ